MDRLTVNNDKWKFHRSLRGRSTATNSATAKTLIPKSATRSLTDDEINFVSNAIYIDPFYLSRDNPFFSAIDAMPDIRPRKKSIPLVSDLVSKLEYPCQIHIKNIQQKHSYP